MIGLLTDFGSRDPYVGQMHAVLAERAPGVPVIDLWHQLPDFDVRAGAYLVAAYARGLPRGSVYICVVDPGVGSGRPAIALELDGDWYVGPDNGLLAIVWRRARTRACHAIDWRPPVLSTSFHGRDLFAPVAAQLTGANPPAMHASSLQVDGGEWPQDLQNVLYFDHYGNAVTGTRGISIDSKSVLQFGTRRIFRAGCFSDVGLGQPFWYENANGLVEIAVNQGSAAGQLGLRLGDAFAVVPSTET